MVICTANFFTGTIRELKDDSILLVYTDAVKTSEVSSQLLQPVGGRRPQVFDGCASVEQIEFLLHPAPEFAPNSAGRFGIAPVVNIGARRIAEAGDHKSSIPEYPLFMYGYKMEAFRA